MGFFSRRRQHERHPLRVQVDLRTEHGFLAATTENLSQGGLFVATAAPYALGETVELVLRLFHAPPMALRGIVRWRRPPGPDGPPGLGLELLDLQDDQRAVIAAFLASGIKPLVER